MFSAEIEDIKELLERAHMNPTDDEDMLYARGSSGDGSGSGSGGGATTPPQGRRMGRFGAGL